MELQKAEGPASPPEQPQEVNVSNLMMIETKVDILESQQQQEEEGEDPLAITTEPEKEKEKVRLV